MGGCVGVQSFHKARERATECDRFISVPNNLWNKPQTKKLGQVVACLYDSWITERLLLEDISFKLLTLYH